MPPKIGWEILYNVVMSRKDAPRLLTIEDVDNMKMFPTEFTSLSCCVPMLRSSCRLEFELARSDEEFQERLIEEAPWVNDFDFKENGLFLAGGAVSAIMLHPDQDITIFDDYDLFLVGHSKESALAAIRNLAAHLYTYYANVGMIRSAGSLTFACSNPRKANYKSIAVQIILQIYPNELAVLSGFDLGSCSVGWSASGRVVMTMSGALAMYCGANVLDLRMRYPSYEHRICKYFQRGFDLILPNLDIGMVNEHGIRKSPTTYALPFINIYHVTSVPCFNVILSSCITPVISVNSKSSYEPGKYMNNKRMALMRTMSAVNEAKGSEVASDKLHLHQKYAPGVDVTKETIEFNNDSLMQAVTETLADPSVIEIKKLRALLGEKLANSLAISVVMNGIVWTEVASTVVARIVELPESIRFPLDFVMVDASNPAGRYPRAVVSERVWYGRAYLELKA